MDTVFIGRLKAFLDAVAETMPLYVPRRVDGHYVNVRYDPGSEAAPEFNAIRTCMPAKEFLFPLREVAAVLPEPLEAAPAEPFAIFGLKACDLQALAILDKVFREDEFEDPFYVTRREHLFVISSDCTEPGESCFCNVLGGKAYAETGYDLNVSPVADGYIIHAGSIKGKRFLSAHASLFGDVPDALLIERDKQRDVVQEQLERINTGFELAAPVQEILEARYESDVFDEQARTCIECQACTRVCPTCHCFFLYDTQQSDYFSKMKMWDSCMRIGYAAVAGGGNPRKLLGDRLRHRLMHKFAYFAERYGLDMCVGCGRCVDAEAGEVDIRVVLKRLNEEFARKGKAVTKRAK